MAERSLSKLEADLQRVPGVKSARVVGDDAPSEIHIVAAPGRSPKQVVRDVQSLAAAGFGIAIDHRIVSVVQLREDVEADADEDGQWPAIERVVLASKGEAGWVKVTLSWPSGETTEGAGAASASREARARGATNAVLQALDPVLVAKDARVDLDHVVVTRVGSVDSVLVSAVYADKNEQTQLLGSAIIRDDVATAAVHALLHALNRKLR